jgi:uncharacterized protein (TIGR02001 family)
MNFKSKLVLALLATSSAAFAQTAPAAPESAIAYNVGVASEYRYRGLAQTKGDAALQGGVDYTDASGFYLGAWGSTIKWIKDAANSAGQTKGSLELDLYGGYKFEAAGLGFDVGYLRYQYMGNTLKASTSSAGPYVNANTDEVYGATTYGVTTLKYSYAVSDLFGYTNSNGSTYWDLSATFDLGGGYSLVPHAGRQAVKNHDVNSYTDVALTLNKDLGDGLSASVAAIRTNRKGNSNFASNLTSYDTAKNALVVGVKYSF